MFEFLLADAGVVTDLPTTSISFFGTLLQNGLLGVALAFTIFMLIRRDRDLQDSWKSRLEDALALATVVKDHTTAITASNMAQDERTRATEASARATEKSAIVLEQLVREVQDLQENVKDLRDRR